jgi:hypothetical protein
MTGLVHPWIAHIALQQNATASRMPSGGICVQCSKISARHKSKIYKFILYHALAAHKPASREADAIAMRPGCAPRMGCRRACGMKLASLPTGDVTNSGKLPVAAPALSL